MINDDGIRGEMIANFVEEEPEWKWVQDVSADAQKQIVGIYFTYGEGEDEEAMMAALRQVPEAAAHLPSHHRK